MAKIIYGIQQIGVGVKDAWDGFRWYGRMLGSDVKVFDDNNTATYMAPYMGGQPHDKHAILAANMQGGSCYEIWQFTDREPQPAKEPGLLGDLGIFVAKIKARDVEQAHAQILARGGKPSPITTLPNNAGTCFFMEDLYGNYLQIVQGNDWFKSQTKHVTGGNCGCIIGVSDIDKARKLYSDVLGYDKVIYDETATFDDFKHLRGGDRKFRRVLLTHSLERKGSLCALLGRSYIELVQLLDDQPKKLFADRYWGDMGFIHLCFDIRDMQSLKEDCAKAGFPFTVESDSGFKMGDAAGAWAYLEDADGTLIEFVETKKIPLIKKLGLYLKLEGRDPYKPVPRWMINAIGFNRVKM